MGKWSFLKGAVPEKALDEQPGYAERYAVCKADYAAHNFEELSEALTKSREIKDDIAKKLSDAALEVTVLERLVIEKLDAAGIESVVAGGYKLTPSVEPVFKKVDGAKLREWAVGTGQEELLSINAKTLESLAKDYFLAEETKGECLPGLELSSTYTKLSRTKQK